jgi:hypothetical protein
MTAWTQLDRWIPSSGPRTLGAIRIIVAAQALWMLLSRDPAGISALPAAVWDLVGEEERLRYLLLPHQPAIETAIWLTAVASISCVLLGVRTRIFALVAALALYHLAPLQALTSVSGPWGKGLTVATLALPILACSPADDRWALLPSGEGPSRDPAAYGWPVMLVRLVFAQIYFFTALARILGAGLDWVSVETVRTHLLLFGVMYPHLATPLNAWLVAHPLVCAFLAGGILAFELAFVLAVFYRRVRLPFALAGIVFHAGLGATLGFRYLNLPHFLLFLDFDPSPKREGRPAARA